MPSHMLRISEMAFYAYHGYYSEEQVTGTWFFVDVDISIPTPEDVAIQYLDDTINYERIYALSKEVMTGAKEALIETLCQKIYRGIRQLHPEIEKIRVEVKKKNPPLKMVGQTSFQISDF